MSAVVLTLLAGACLVAVVWPLVVHARASAGGPVELAEALDERDRALAALRELEFDHRSGKIDDADYRELVRSLRLAAADAVRRVDGDA